jgi:amidase
MLIYELSATEIIAKIKARELTCIEVAAAFIDRIKTVNLSLNAIHQFDPNRILAEAHQKDEDIRIGKPLGKLHGLPISLKDAFYAPGFRGAKGNIPLFEASPTDRSAVAVQRILAEGAIILGITNTPELCAAFETSNSLNGRTNNPYDITRVPGGSSGGEAALIAAGGSCLGLGSDAGGSIREPAHYCGIVGFKPTKGLVSTTGNVPNDAGGLHTQLLTFGPMGRKIEDLELLLSIIAGPDDQDPFSVPVSLKSSDGVDVFRLKVIYFLDNGVIKPDEDTIRNVRAAVERLAPYVASVTLVTPPEILKQTYRLVWDTCFLGGDKGKMLMQSFARLNQTEFSPLYNQHLKKVQSSSFDTTELRLRVMQMHEYKQAFMKLMHGADILLCPVAATPARLHGTTHDHLEDYTYTMMSNLTGAPAASINCGFSESGLPIGLQIIAKPWDDHLVLAFAKQAQTILGIPRVVNVRTM